ncbi:hypothetical protein HNY73_014428 [Argiope bruennichi]|uniref:Uncharacterized protein n=1 Tax=Argiope bruennichi TaxID=94029 RepID=A0A8T0EQM8_ARGBR|nr:hypothetical protein HNY73_014428 [Argiope bruennichi]
MTLKKMERTGSSGSFSGELFPPLKLVANGESGNGGREKKIIPTLSGWRTREVAVEIVNRPAKRICNDEARCRLLDIFALLVRNRVSFNLHLPN